MKYDNYAEALGFKKEKNVYITEVNGFKVYLKDWQYMVLSIPSFYIPLDRPLDKDEVKRIEIACFKNACGIASLGNKNDTLIVSLADGIKTKEKTQEIIKAQIEEVTLQLKEDGYLPMTICPVCHQATEYGTFGDNYCPIHEDCIKSYMDKLEEHIVSEEGFSPKYIVAILLSILGILIGLTPALLLSIFNGDYFAGLLALVPILSILGFALAKAPQRKWLKLSIGLLIMASVIGFLFFAIPYMANKNEMDLYSYMFTEGWVGFRKAIFGFIISLAGFGGMKFLNKFKKDYKKELSLFLENENEAE